VWSNHIRDVSDEKSRLGCEQDRIWEGSGIWIIDVGRQTDARALEAYYNTISVTHDLEILFRALRMTLIKVEHRGCIPACGE